jgi:hypothetical protein
LCKQPNSQIGKSASKIYNRTHIYLAINRKVLQKSPNQNSCWNLEILNIYKPKKNPRILTLIWSIEKSYTKQTQGFYKITYSFGFPTKNPRNLYNQSSPIWLFSRKSFTGKINPRIQYPEFFISKINPTITRNSVLIGHHSEKKRNPKQSQNYSTHMKIFPINPKNSMLFWSIEKFLYKTNLSIRNLSNINQNLKKIKTTKTHHQV